MSMTSAIFVGMVLLANAVPHGHLNVAPHGQKHAAMHDRRQAAAGTTFGITVQNNCATDYTFGVATRPENGTCVPVSGQSASIASGSSATFQAPFFDIGGRMGAGDVCGATALFEFGYANMTLSDGTFLEGTFYDISLIDDPDNTGMGIYPANSACNVKVCASKDDCPLDQGWTNADQIVDGSPADNGCYVGPMDFSIVWCPSGSATASGTATTTSINSYTNTGVVPTTSPTSTYVQPSYTETNPYAQTTTTLAVVTTAPPVETIYTSVVYTASDGFQWGPPGGFKR